MDLAEILKLGHDSGMSAGEIQELIASIDERNERAAQRELRKMEMEKEEKEKEREEREK